MSDLILEGAPNFRDMGGYTNKHGRTIKKGRLFRSDHLGKLTPKDIQILQNYARNGWRVLDFRGAEERLSQPCAIPNAPVLSLSIEPSIVQKLTDLMDIGAHISSQKTIELMQDTYRDFICQHSLRFAEFFQEILDHPTTPIIFHCTAGKDRTGVAATLLLHALDVSMETIWEDYLITNERLKNKAILATVPPQVAQVLQTVKPDFLQAALDTVHQDYGHLDAYLEKQLGISQEIKKQLAEQLLV